MKILHICNWHPNRENPYEAIWIKRHIDALSPFCEQEVWHLQVRNEKKWKYQKYTDESGCRHLILDIPFKQWIFVEIITAFFLWNLLRKSRKNKFDLINFHIAYPLLSYWKLYKNVLRIPVLLTEHWSAYHLNFGMPLETKKLDRVKNIFKQDLRLITVSNALLNDIKNFSSAELKAPVVIPNIVDTAVFKPSESINNDEKIHFLMVSSWAYPKNPVLAIRAFAEVLKSNKSIYLDIGGYGNLIEKMSALVIELKISDHVKFLGKMSPNQIADQQQKSSAFIHCSGYETFSVVCAEALCCGTPVIASAVGGITELIGPDDGILVQNHIDNWINAINEFLYHKNFDKNQIAVRAALKFDSKVIGKKYFETVKGFLDDLKK